MAPKGRAYTCFCRIKLSDHQATLSYGLADRSVAIRFNPVARSWTRGAKSQIYEIHIDYNGTTDPIVAPPVAEKRFWGIGMIESHRVAYRR
jgi:hypothetical protein